MATATSENKDRPAAGGLIRFDPGVHRLALDFDGVICDSIAECLVVGYNAFHAIQGRGHAASRFESIPPDQRTEARRIRNFIRSSEDYVYLFHAITEHADVRDQAAFDSFCSTYAGSKESYFNAFYAQRERMAVQFPERWIELNPLYPGMRDFLLRFGHPNRLFIVSTKRSSYIRQLLDGHGIPFEPSHVLDTLSSGSKRVILNGLIQDEKSRAGSLFFVDDQVHTLLQIGDPAIRCILAEWGYTGVDQIAAARNAGLAVMDLALFYRTFLPGGSIS